jgi:hypothetical protein
MNKFEANEVQLWQTKLKANKKPDNAVSFMFSLNDTWVVTEFVRRLNSNDLEFVVQPLVNEGKMNEGVTGLVAYVVTIDEFIEYFDLK